MKTETILGLIAGILTTASFLPQVIKTIRLKETKDLSLGMYTILFLGIFLWLIYGMLIKNLPVIAANIVSLIFVAVILAFKVRYG